MNNIKTLSFLLSLIWVHVSFGQNSTPNILMITLDDMNWDSPYSNGGKITDLTPNIDSLANSGVLFKNAYVQAPNCSPSRSVIQTGLYPHQSGMRGFFYATPNNNTLPEILKNNGYFTGVLNKTADTSLSPDLDRYWDVSKNNKNSEKRSADSYSKLLNNFLNQAKKVKKPFYCIVNIADPHKPFFNDPSSTKKGFKEFMPSKIYNLEDVTIPLFLPKDTKIKKEILNYINSVKRGDDCVGEILKMLKKHKISENTIVILLSDHGMPLPFAKSTVYQNGLKTPLIVSYKSKFIPSIERKSIVSAIDLAPTILDMTQLEIPKEFEGQSFYPVLINEKEQVGKYVFGQFDENAGGTPRPSRTILNGRYGYIFNPWATGMFTFKSASTYHATYKRMKKLSLSNKEVQKRFDFWKLRIVEEFYDYEKDPDALNNLIDDPAYKEKIDAFRNQLMLQMKKTKDYVLVAFQNRDDKSYLNEWMKEQISEAEIRMNTIKWKRPRNGKGSTKNNTNLFINN